MAAEQHFCERHHGPAVASPVRIPPDGTRETEHLCASDLAEERMSGRILLQSLDDGRLTDSQGGTVAFKNAVAIMTSDLGADGIVDRDGVAESRKEAAQPEVVGS